MALTTIEQLGTQLTHNLQRGLRAAAHGNYQDAADRIREVESLAQVLKAHLEGLVKETGQ
jgi:hypothetical protein